MLRTSSLVYFFLQFSLSILPVFNWVHRRHSCLLPFIHQLHSPVPVYTQQEFNWVAGLLHEASHYAPTLLPGGSSQGWLSPCDTPGEGSVKAAPGFQGMQVGHLAGNFVLCCCPRCFLCQQSSYFWLPQVSCECPPWAVGVKWHLHGPISLSWAELVMQVRIGKEKYIQESWYLSLKGDALQSISLGISLWPFCCGELCFFPLQIHVCIMNKDVSSFAASSKLLCH